MAAQTIFDLCQPRADVLSGRVRDEEFAADLAKVASGRGVTPEYGDPAIFFRHTHPTAGLKLLLETVCRRLTGTGGEANSLIRLDTQFGGGKTHSLIALVHAARGLKGVQNAGEFLDPALIPSEEVRVAALDGENADPANGVTLEEGLRATSLWGEMAYRLAGREGYERVRKSDEQHLAPGTDTLTELFADRPCLILIDEVAVYLRKAAMAFPGKADQFAAFLQSLLKAVSQSPRAVLVFTLAVNAEDSSSKDAYGREQQEAMAAFDEAVKVAGRKATVLNPTRDDETAAVLRRRLFDYVNSEGSKATVAAYRELWKRHAADLPEDAADARTATQFAAAYPFHPEVMATLMEKTSGLATFQRTRGMLRLLARTVANLWETRPADATALHPHHIDPGFAPTRQEMLTRWEQNVFAPALAADIAAGEGLPDATAAAIDAQHFAGRPPLCAYLARTVLLHTLAPEAVRGINSERLAFSLLCPGIEPAFIEQARQKFIERSLYLDDRPGSPMRFMAEPNLVQLVNRHSQDVDSQSLKTRVDERVRDLFAGGSNRPFEPVFFPGGPHAVADDAGDGKPLLVVLHHDAHAVHGDIGSLPADIARLASTAGTQEAYRRLQNNLVFVVAEKADIERMKANSRRQLGLERLKAAGVDDLAPYQRAKLEEMLGKVSLDAAVSIAQCYRHVFYPDRAGMQRDRAKLSHTAMSLTDTAAKPGNCQLAVQRSLADQNQLLGPGDDPPAPAYVRDQTPLKGRGVLTTAALRDQFRQAPNLPILLGDEPLTACIRRGIEQSVFIYRVGDQVYGPGDPAHGVTYDDQSFVHTYENALEQKLWPRVEPEPVAPAGGGGSLGKDHDGGGPGTGTSATDNTTPDSEFASSAAGEFSATGPLRQALTDVFAAARDAKCRAFVMLRVQIDGMAGTWAFHPAAGSLRGPVTTCSFDVDYAAEGVETFQLEFRGSIDRANKIKSFLQPTLTSPTTCEVEGNYEFDFSEKLLLTHPQSEEAFIESLTKFGTGEVFVKATAAPAMDNN